MSNSSIKKVDFVRSLFEDDVFLAPTKIGTKQPIYLIDSKSPRTYKPMCYDGAGRMETERNAPKVEYLAMDLMKDPEYLDFLERDDHNLAVLVGELSNGVCSIDMDEPRFEEDFFSLNGFLRDTLTTKANRGIQIWFKLKGICPSPFYLTDIVEREKHYGEFRSTPWRTHIYGTHPTGAQYKVINTSKPKKVNFEDIKWPEYLGFSRFYLGGKNFPMKLLSSRKTYKDTFKIKKNELVHKDYFNLAVSYLDENLKELFRYDIFPIELSSAYAAQDDEYLTFERLFELPIKPSHLWIEPNSVSAGYGKRIKFNFKEIHEKSFTLQERIDANWSFC